MKEAGFYTAEDYIYGNAPRAYGRETELESNLLKRNVISDRFELASDKHDELPGPLRLIDFVPRKYAVSHGRGKKRSALISTGGELYLDRIEYPDGEISGVFEAATAECLTPEEVRTHEHADIKILLETLDNLAHGLDLPKPEVYKRGGYVDVHSPEGRLLLKQSSLGHHEHYSTLNVYNRALGDLVYTPSSRSHETAALSTFFVLRKLIDGAGMVADGHFSITQKPDAFTFSDIENGDRVTHGKKIPFARRRDRIEARTGEGNFSDWAIELETAMTSLFLRYIDHGDFPRNLLLKDPRQALLQIARNPKADVELVTGLWISAPALLRDIMHGAAESAGEYGELPEFETDAVELYDSYYYDLRDNVSLEDSDVRALADRVDWAARLQQFYNHEIRHKDISARNLDHVAMDLKMSEANDERNTLRARFRRYGHAATRITVPEPPETRAKWRTPLAKDWFQKGILGKVAWSQVESIDESTPTQGLLTPFWAEPNVSFMQGVLKQKESNKTENMA